MIGVRVVLMAMGHGHVAMPMTMHRRGVADLCVRVPVVIVMGVVMFVGCFQMGMSMGVTFGEVQNNASCHQEPGEDQPYIKGFSEEGQGKRRSEERRYGKVGTGPRSAEVSQTHHEQRQACAVA